MHDDDGSDGQCHHGALALENSISVSDETEKMGHHDEPSFDRVVDGDGVIAVLPSVDEELEGTELVEDILPGSADLNDRHHMSAQIFKQEENGTILIRSAETVAASEEISWNATADLASSPMPSSTSPTRPATPADMVAKSEDNHQVAVVEGGMIRSMEILQELYQRKCKECEGLRKTISFLNEAVQEAEDLVYEKSYEIERMELRLQGVTYLYEEKWDDELCIHREKSKSKKKKNKKKDNPSVRRPIVVRPKAPPTPEGERKRNNNDSRIKRKAKSKEGEKSNNNGIESELVKTIESEPRNRSKTLENRKHDKENDSIRNKKATKPKPENSTHPSKKSQSDDSCTEKSERTKRKEALLAAISARDGNAPPTSGDENHEIVARIPTPTEQSTSDGEVVSGDEGTIEITFDESGAAGSKEERLTEISAAIFDAISAKEEASIDVPARESDGQSKKETVSEISIGDSDEIILEEEAIGIPNEDTESSSRATTNPISLQIASSAAHTFEVKMGSDAHLLSQQMYPSEQQMEFDLDEHIVFPATEDLLETNEGGNNGPDMDAPENQPSDCSLNTIPFSTDRDPCLDQYSVIYEQKGSSPHSVTSVEQLVVTSPSEKLKHAVQVIQGSALFSDETDLVLSPPPLDKFHDAIDLDRSDGQLLLFVDETQNLGIDLEFIEECEMTVDHQATIQSVDDMTLGVKSKPASLSSKPEEAPTLSTMQDPVYFPSQQINEAIVVRVEI